MIRVILDIPQIILLFLLMFLEFPYSVYSLSYQNKYESVIYRLLGVWDKQIEEDIADIRSYVRETTHKIKQKNLKSINDEYWLASTYLSILDYNLLNIPISLSKIKRRESFFYRANLIYRLITNKSAINYVLKLQKQKDIPDYDYFLFGISYILAGNKAAAKNYFLRGIKYAKRLLTAFDVMFTNIDDIFKVRKKMFILLLPIIRWQDVCFFLKNTMYSMDFSCKRISSLKDSDVQELINKQILPIYYYQNKYFFSYGDFLALFYIMELVSERHIDGTSTNIFKDMDLPFFIKKSASFLYEKKVIFPYLDTFIPLLSPISGYRFWELYNNSIRYIK